MPLQAKAGFRVLGFGVCKERHGAQDAALQCPAQRRQHGLCLAGQMLIVRATCHAQWDVTSLCKHVPGRSTGLRAALLVEASGSMAVAWQERAELRTAVAFMSV